ncbi:MAG: CXXX repeat peptide maturase [Muribaculaceae bacterium]|nr:CXXX repeat peptide maturase [Muribaculaceae bacterium]
MLKYMIVQLCDTSASFCHYPNTRAERKLISVEALRKALRMAMCENMTVQFLYPDYALPSEYVELIESVDHAKVAPVGVTDEADIVVLPSLDRADEVKEGDTVCVRISRAELCDSVEALSALLRRVTRLNVSLTDSHTAVPEELPAYADALDRLGETVKEEYARGHFVQLNLLTDRLMLKQMNNCNAGAETVTLAPDGKFYICPAFYLEGDSPVGDPDAGIEVPNAQLYALSHAPICRSCDAWHCRRCVWLNRKRTLEVNTPGRGQCLTAHAEREASRRLKERMDAAAPGNMFNEIEKLDYTDPFEKVSR